MSQDEALALFDANARRELNMSGEEFLRALDSGELGEDLDSPEIMHVLMLLPLVRS